MPSRGPFKKVVTGQKTVTAAGTDEQMTTTSQDVDRVIVKALSTNTDLVFVGMEGVAAASGFQLTAKEEILLKVDDPSTLWVDAAVNGEGVCFIALRD